VKSVAAKHAAVINPGSRKANQSPNARQKDRRARRCDARRVSLGDVTRISPEAPVPVVDIKRESTHLGGAANVLANLLALERRRA